MDPTKRGVYRVMLNGGYDWQVVADVEAEMQAEGLINVGSEEHPVVISGTDEAGDPVYAPGYRTDVGGKLRKRVLVEGFTEAVAVIQDPAQIPLTSLTRYVATSVLPNVDLEQVMGVAADYGRSTAEVRDVDNVGRKLAAMLECDYEKDG